MGGLVGENRSNTIKTIVVNEEGQEQQVLDRDIARIDRCSVVDLTMGEQLNNDGTRSVLGARGDIGGLVGTNEGGTLVYSYVRGTVYFANENTLQVVYGGVVARNKAMESMPVVGDYKYPYQGAHIKDCYSDIKTFLDITTQTVPDSSAFAGAIAINQDYSNGEYETSNYNLVNNYILGVYYNADNLNFAQEGKTKNFEGIASFKMGTSDVDFEDKKTIVYGYKYEDMKTAENYVSHLTKIIEFNEDGVSKGIVEKEVLWLFDTVWSINNDNNDNLPYLNYQLIYVPDDFGSVGVPTISNALDEFKYQVQVDYPVAILSGTNDKLYMTVGEVYQLQYSPAGIDLTWTSTDSSVVDVDTTNGVLTAKKKGAVTITATTKTGRTDSITVIVENIVYSFMNVPEKIKIKVGQQYNLNNIYLNPTPITGSIAYTIADTTIATYNEVGGNKYILGQTIGTTSVTLTFGAYKLIVPVEVITADKTPVSITANPSMIEGSYSKIAKSGTITLSSSQTLTYQIENLATINSVVDLTINGNTINYTIKGTGSIVARVLGSNADYTGNIDIHFNIYDDVTLTANPSYVSGDISNINTKGAIQISNNLGKSFNYTATSGNSNVTVSMSGSKLSYEIKNAVSTNVVVSINDTNYVGSVTILFNIYKTATPSMVLNYRNTTIYVGNTVTLKPVSGNYTLPITYTSNDASIASVNSNGVVTGIKAGQATITATSNNGASATCTITVKPVDKASIRFNSSSTYTLEVQSTLDLNSHISGNWDTLTYKTSNSSIASVNGNGVVTGVAVGQATITITASKNGTSASIKAIINVIAKNVEITLNPTDALCEPGTSITIDATVVNSSEPIQWSYTNSGYIDGTPSEANRSVDITVVNDTNAIGKTITVTATIDTTSVSMTITIAKDGYVYDYDTLNAMRYNPSKSYILVADINVGSWTPIENFSGKFESQVNSATGEYYTISNIQVTGNYSYAGLFANIKNNARIENITIKDSSITATTGAGGLVGKVEGTSSIYRCKVINTTISGGKYAGGIVGYSNGSSISVCDVEKCTISATTNTTSSAVGGIAGANNGANISNMLVKSSTMKVTSSAHGNVGGIAGTNSKIINNSCVSNCVIQTGSKDIDFAGGIVGYSTGSLQSTVVTNGTKISGYNVGGIGGELNVSRKFILTFSELKKGFRYEDIKSFKDATTKASVTSFDVKNSAVHDDVTITGTYVGGLFSIVKSGIVNNCYTQASLKGNGSSAVIAGFAKSIEASGFTNEGSSSSGGQVGIIMNCYSACSFGGTTKKNGKFAISESTVHNYEGFDLFGSGDDNTKTTGYVFRYVFDNTKASGTSYFASSNGKDYINAKKTTSQMKSQSTYTDSTKSFSGSVWKFNGDYPTLSSESIVRY